MRAMAGYAAALEAGHELGDVGAGPSVAQGVGRVRPRHHHGGPGMTVELDWTPPAGMATRVAASWRAFYLKGLNPKEGGFIITPSEYRDLYLIQMGRCFICQTAQGIHPDDPKGKGSQRLGVDHNHATGAVRGLLCAKGEWSCNRIVGRYRDSPKAFLRGASYLQAPPAWSLRKVRSEHPEALEEDILSMAAGAVAFIRGALDG